MPPEYRDVPKRERLETNPLSSVQKGTFLTRLVYTLLSVSFSEQIQPSVLFYPDFHTPLSNPPFTKFIDEINTLQPYLLIISGGRAAVGHFLIGPLEKGRAGSLGPSSPINNNNRVVGICSLAALLYPPLLKHLETPKYWHPPF